MSKFLSIYIIFIFILLNSTMLLKTQEENETQKEYVEVINVEVIVRAFKKKQFIGGLKKSDFTLLENGEKQAITSFMEIRRKIGIEGLEKKKEESSKKPHKKRFFLFYFWVYEPESRYNEALDYFFNRVYREGDYALILIENQVFKITRKEQVSQTLAQVKSKLVEVTRGAKKEHGKIVERVADLFKIFIEQYRTIEEEEKRMGNPRTREEFKARRKRLVEQLGINYKHMWDEYRLRRINVNVNRLKALAVSLKPVNFEKWGLVFCQHDTFPQFNSNTFLTENKGSIQDNLELKKMFSVLTTDMNRPSGSLSIFKGIQQAFINANTTFHLFLSKVVHMGQFESRYLKVGHVYSDWQESFRNISEATGGEVIDSTKIEESLAQAIKKEDIYYRLTYAPKITDKKAREIKVKVKKKRLKVLYNQQVILKKTRDITLDNFSFTYPVLQFTLNNYQQFFDGNRLYGDIGIKITSVDSNGDMLAFGKTLEPVEDKMTVSLKINFPRGGKYTLIIEALDKHNGRSSVFSERVNVPKTSLNGPVLITKVHKKTKGIDKKNKLEVILEKSARYCEKLEKTTFYFTCEEEVTDVYFIKGKKVKNDRYLHDYQILMGKNGKMSEKREPAREKSPKKKRRMEKNESGNFFLPNFFSQYPFLMPVTMLARGNQKNYRYQLLSREKVGGAKTFKLSVEPKKKGAGGINHGVVWVDEKDGSVVKIELNPASLIGIGALKATARKKGTKIRVTDIHWYEVKKKGVRFASRTEISEINFARDGIDTKKLKEVEHSRTVFTYKNYLFFNVNVNVTDASHK